MSLPAIKLPTEVSLVEVGPRDGLQNEPVVLDSKTRCQFARQLAACGLKRIEAGAFVHPQRVPQMVDSDQVLKGLVQDTDVSWPVLVPNRQGLEAAITAGAREIAVSPQLRKPSRNTISTAAFPKVSNASARWWNPLLPKD